MTILRQMVVLAVVAREARSLTSPSRFVRSVTTTPGAFREGVVAQAKERRGEEPEIGKQAKGFYIRPSAAIERGGGFFIPGLEGSKLRVALGSGLIALVVVSAALGDATTPASVRVSEAIAFLAAVGIVAPYVLGDLGAPPPPPPDTAPRVRETALDADDADEVSWARAALRSAVPEATFVALLDDTGTVLLFDATTSQRTNRISLPSQDLVRRSTASALFDALGDVDSKVAFVVPTKDGARTWLLGARDADVLRETDRAWIARLLPTAERDAADVDASRSAF